MAIQESKSILAKLLATENITVSHQSVKTAYFDLKSRTMVLPVWKEMDGNLYDLLTGHEVGHALYTPAEGWHNEVSTTSKKFKDFLNVVEDARIEKLIKRKFPGLSKSFANAYASLYDRDFFGVKKLGDLNKLNLIDRINLRFKMGAHVVVTFNDAERDIVRDVENAETWDQVVEIAKRVYEYVKENEPEKVQNSQDLSDAFSEQMSQDSGDMDSEENDLDDLDDSDDGEETDEDSENVESGLDGESDGDDSDDSDADSSDDEESDEETEADGSYAGGAGDSEDENDDEPQSVTDRIFRQREQELVNASGKVFMYNLPDADLDRIILPNTEVVNDLEQYFKKQIAEPHKPYGRAKVSYETVVQKSVRRFNTENKKVIMHILKEFEMRKVASQYARAQTARTGELNMNVLHKYKFSNDLFRKITVVPKGKNHGYILFVDMSGSMSDLLRNTIDQLLILASFCKLAKVPFEAYGFSDDYYNNNKLREMKSVKSFASDRKNEMYVSEDWFHLKHLIGTSLPPLQYRKAFNMLCVVAAEYPARRTSYFSAPKDGDFDNWMDSGFGLHGTPFSETLLASREIITKFQKLHQLEVCNVVYLTDGMGNQNRVRFPQNSAIELNHGFINKSISDAVVYVVDKKTQKKIKFETRYPDQEMQTRLTQLVADVTGCKHIGFYIMHRKELSRAVRDYLPNGSFQEIETAKKSIRENNFFSCANLGYEKYFYVGLPSDNVKDEALQITQEMNKSKMAKVFSNTLTSKRTNRLLLTKLAEELAVA